MSVGAIECAPLCAEDYFSRGNPVSKAMYQDNTSNTSIIGIQFTPLSSSSYASVMRAWKIFMETLNPSAICGCALFDGALQYPSGEGYVVIAVSGPETCIEHVRRQFSHPSLAQHPGLFPPENRFVARAVLPKELLTAAGYISPQGKLLIHDNTSYLADIANAVHWPIASMTDTRRRLGVYNSFAEDAATMQIKSTVLDGATQMHLRLWRAPKVRRNTLKLPPRYVIGITVLVAVILMVSAIFVYTNQGTAVNAGGSTTIGQNYMLIQPSVIQAPCKVGETQSFTITNTGTSDMKWSVSGNDYSSIVSIHPLQGTLAAGSVQIITAAPLVYSITQQRLLVRFTSNLGSAAATLIVGGCPLQNSP